MMGILGDFLGAFASGGPLNAPSGFVFGSDNNLYVTNYFGNEVLKYDGKTGAFLGVFASGGGLQFPNRVAFGPDSNLYVSGIVSNNVLKYDGKTGAFLGAFVPNVKQPTNLVFVTVPESSGLLGIWVFGVFGVAILRFSKQKRKNSVRASSSLPTQIT
ncbi:MAG: hypothetical protein HC908_01945 [Calothrix sp. SM1_7_51]|nr:hypothetical protein [Calothrix sp. SM1_7_51]